MDTSPLTNFLNHIQWLVDKGNESGELSFRDAQATLQILDLRARESQLTVDILTTARPRLADLVDRMNVRYAVPAVDDSPPLPPAAASDYIAASPTGTHVSETTNPISDAESSDGSLPASPIPPSLRPRLLPLPDDTIPHRPSPSTAADKGKGKGMGGEAPTALPPLKRPWVDTQGNHNSVPSSSSKNGKYNPDVGALVSRQPTRLHVGPSSVLGAHLSVSIQANDAPQSSAIQTRPTTVLYDSSGAEINCAHLSRVLDRYSFITLRILPVAYRLTYGCELMPRNVNRQEFVLRLIRVDGFRYWYLNPEGANSDASNGLSILQRDGPALERMHHGIAQGLTGAPEAGVCAPLLCYYFATLCCMQASQLAGPILSELFAKATGRSLSSLVVITEHGVQTMTDDQLAGMAYKWLKDLCSYIAAGDHMDSSLEMATKCYDAYTNRCHGGGSDGTHIDPRLTIFQKMLATNELDSQLLLGISSTAFERLYKSLILLMYKDVDEPTLIYLKRLSVRMHKKDR